MVIWQENGACQWEWRARLVTDVTRSDDNAIELICVSLVNLQSTIGQTSVFAPCPIIHLSLGRSENIFFFIQAISESYQGVHNIKDSI